MKEILIPLNFTPNPVVYDTEQSFSTADASSAVLAFSTTEPLSGVVASLTIKNISQNANLTTVLIDRIEVSTSPFRYTFVKPLASGDYYGEIILKRNLEAIGSAQFTFGVNSSLAAEVLPHLIQAYSLDDLVEQVEAEINNLKAAYNLNVESAEDRISTKETTITGKESIRALNETQRKANELTRIAQELSRVAAEGDRQETFDTLVDSAVIEQVVVQEVAEKYQELEATNSTEMVSFREQLAHLDDTKADLADLPSGAYVFKGSTTFALLPTVDNVLGDTYWTTDNLTNYAWTGTAWTPIGDGAFTDGSVTNSKLASGAVSYKKTDFMITGINLFDPSKAIRGQVVDSLTGQVVVNASYATYELDVIAGNYLKVQSDIVSRNWYFRHIATYDSTGAFRADLSWNNSTTPKIFDGWLIPAGAVKLIVTIENGYVDLPCMIFYGQSFTTYESYRFVGKSIVKLNAEQLSQVGVQKYDGENLIADNTVSKNKVAFFESNENFFEVGTQTEGYYLDPNGVATANASYYYTKKYPLVNGQSISARARGANPVHMRKITVYDAQGLAITELGFNQTPDVEFKSTFTATDARIASIAITVSNTLTNFGGCPAIDLMLAYDSVVPTLFVDHAVVTTEEIGLSNRQLTDAADYVGGGADKMSGLVSVDTGDSIAAGDGNLGKGYAHILGEEYGMAVHSYAYGGATLSKGINPTNNIVDQIDEAIATETAPPDIVFINGRTNDMNSAYDLTFQLGAMTATFDTTTFAYDLNTFTGSMEYIFAKVKTNWPDAVVIFVSVHNMSSRDLVKQKQLHDRTKEVCEKWAIGLADIYSSGQMNSNIPSMLKYTNPTETQPLGDRTHPNDLGYREKYLPVIRQEVLKYLK